MIELMSFALYKVIVVGGNTITYDAFNWNKDLYKVSTADDSKYGDNLYTIPITRDNVSVK